MKCTNENFRNVVFSSTILATWCCPRHGGVDKHEKTYLRGRGIGGKPKWFGIILTETDYRERYMARRAPTNRTQLASRFSLLDSGQDKTGFAILFRLKRLFGTKRLLKYIWYELKRLFGTNLCRHHQSDPENGVNSRPFCHRFFKSRKTV